MKILFVIIEQGKVPVLGKPHTIQLIKSDFHLKTMIFVSIRNKGNVESDIKVSERNYWSRPRYSIEDAILEKIFYFDNSLVTEK